MNLEQLEFSITQYLDGTLPADQVAALEERLASDPQARALLEEHRKLLAALRGFRAPELAWSELARDFSAVVTGTVDEQSKAEDRKLNAFLRSAMPPVPEVKWDALAERISGAIDAELDSADEEDQKLDRLLHAAPMPAVNWDRLAGQISEAIEHQARQEEQAQRKRMRIFSASWSRKISAFAVAAVLLIVAGVSLRIFLDRSGNVTGPINPPTIIVQGPTGEAATGRAVVDIQIGPSPAFAHLEQPTRREVVIVAPVGTPEDAAGGLGFD